MKKLFLLFTLSFFFIGLFANPVIESQAYISEIYFDENDDWTIELYFYFLNEEYADFRFYTSSGSADITIYSSSPIVLITANDLNTSLAINRGGDFVYLTQFEDMFPLCQTIIFGNYTGSEVAAPLITESLVNVVVEDNGYFNENEYWLVKDIVPSLGYINEPVKESFAGTLVDNSGIAISYIEIDYGAVGDLPKIWTDETGYFETENMYCKNYTIKMGPDLILEDPLTIHIGSSVYRDYQYDGPGQVQIDGYCFLQYASELEGSVIYFRKNCPEWVIDSAVTDINGHFDLELDIGFYSLIYHHESHYPYYNFEENDMFIDKTLYDITIDPGFVNTIIGNYQQGVWNSVYPYWILGDVIIDEGDTLKIHGGCEIDFKDNFIFDVYGSLFVEGSEGDSVYFDKQAGSWSLKEYSLHFNGTTCNNSEVKHAVFNNSGAGIQFFDASVAIKNSRFYDNSRAVNLYGNSAPIFDSVLFDSNSQAIRCYNQSFLTIRNSIFYDSYIGIYSYDNSSLYISHSFFIDNSATVYLFSDNEVKIFNNVFYNNSSALAIRDESWPSIHNNVFYENNSTISFSNEGLINEDILYNTFWENSTNFYIYSGVMPEGLGEIVTVNNNSDSSDIYYNIFMDPLFVDTINMDFHLTEFSPCIDAGNPEFPLDPDSTIADIGVYYYYHVLPYIKEDESILKYFKVYPNPANSIVTISYAVSDETINENVALKVLNLKGKEVYAKHFGHSTTVNLSMSEIAILPGTYLFVLELRGKRIGIEKVIVK